jgi:hypothetical protein
VVSNAEEEATAPRASGDGGDDDEDDGGRRTSNEDDPRASASVPFEATPPQTTTPRSQLLANEWRLLVESPDVASTLGLASGSSRASSSSTFASALDGVPVTLHGGEVDASSSSAASFPAAAPTLPKESALAALQDSLGRHNNSRMSSSSSPATAKAKESALAVLQRHSDKSCKAVPAALAAAVAASPVACARDDAPLQAQSVTTAPSSRSEGTRDDSRGDGVMAMTATAKRRHPDLRGGRQQEASAAAHSLDGPAAAAATRGIAPGAYSMPGLSVTSSLSLSTTDDPDVDGVTRHETDDDDEPHSTSATPW